MGDRRPRRPGNGCWACMAAVGAFALILALAVAVSWWLILEPVGGAR